MDWNFYCKYERCKYESPFYNCFLNHVRDKHKFQRGCKRLCGIFSCLSVYTKLHGYGKHDKRKHYWFFVQNMKYFKFINARRGCTRFLNKHWFKIKIKIKTCISQHKSVKIYIEVPK